MSWIVDLNGKLKESVMNNGKFLRVPEGGNIAGVFKMQPPRKESKSWKEGEPERVSYLWETVEGKVLSASERLSLEITEALKPYVKKIEEEGTESVVLEIFNKGTKTKPIYLVVVRGGV